MYFDRSSPSRPSRPCLHHHTGMRSARPRALAAVLCIAALLCACTAHAQTDTVRIIPSIHERPDLWVLLQDSSAMYLVSEDGHDTTNANDVTPSYTFAMDYDSLGHINYTLTEWRRNGTPLVLPTWIDGRRVNASATLLSCNSTTETFTPAAGDTLSFYRELIWKDPTTSLQDTNNYYALDSLDFAMELLRASDSARVALLDSIGILPNATPGRPRIHGAQPLMSIIRYVVPPELAGTPAFMRMLLYHRGPGPYWFTRRDGITLSWSHRLSDSSFQYYLELFGRGSLLYKQQTLEDLAVPTPSTPRLEVAFTTAGPRQAAITFDSAPDGATALGVYDVSGHALFYPYSTPASSGTVSVGYVFPGAGSYFVGLLHGGRLVATRKIIVP